MLTLAPVTSLSQLLLRPWAFSTHQLATSWLTMEGGSPSILARLERPAIYFKGFLFSCSALMLFCCMTVCRPLTARPNDRTFVLLSQFSVSLGNGVPREKIILIYSRLQATSYFQTMSVGFLQCSQVYLTVYFVYCCLLVIMAPISVRRQCAVSFGR